MIVVDASALLAIHFAEPERDAFTNRIVASPAIISAVNAWEALVRAYAVDGAAGRMKLENLITSLGVEIASVDAETTFAAADAFARYGKRAPAKLNMGDCFAYALAKTRDAPLLYKGGDFSNTDIQAA
ncbi:MAG: type II toxin-antitoxin system VapC family toxin [Caulobacterales bacterium]|jgi:ribonuclease VapC|nr:type II toxin-antitoxin system VapC family toxin [Caulobacterales bacterium]